MLTFQSNMQCGRRKSMCMRKQSVRIQKEYDCIRLVNLPDLKTLHLLQNQVNLFAINAINCTHRRRIKARSGTIYVAHSKRAPQSSPDLLGRRGGLASGRPDFCNQNIHRSPFLFLFLEMLPHIRKRSFWYLQMPHIVRDVNTASIVNRLDSRCFAFFCLQFTAATKKYFWLSASSYSREVVWLYRLKNPTIHTKWSIQISTSIAVLFV